MVSWAHQRTRELADQLIGDAYGFRWRWTMLTERLRRAGWMIVDPILDVPTVCRRRLDAFTFGCRRARWNLAAAANDLRWSRRPRRRTIVLRPALPVLPAGARRAGWLVADAILDLPTVCRRRLEFVPAAARLVRSNAVAARRLLRTAGSAAWMHVPRGRIVGLASVPLVSALALVIGLSSGPADSSPLAAPPALVQEAAPVPALAPVRRNLAAPRRTQVVRTAAAPHPARAGSKRPTPVRSSVAPGAGSVTVARRRSDARPAARPKAARPTASPTPAPQRPRRTPSPRRAATPAAAPARPTPAAPAAAPVAVPAGLPAAGQQQPAAQQPAQKPAADQGQQPSPAQPSVPPPAPPVKAPSTEGTAPVPTPPASTGQNEENENRWGQGWNHSGTRDDGDRDRDRDGSDRRRDDRDD